MANGLVRHCLRLATLGAAIGSMMTGLYSQDTLPECLTAWTHRFVHDVSVCILLPVFPLGGISSDNWRWRKEAIFKRVFVFMAVGEDAASSQGRIREKSSAMAKALAIEARCRSTKAMLLKCAYEEKTRRSVEPS